MPQTAIAERSAAYHLRPDSTARPGVPKGEVLTFNFAASNIFPGTSHEYWVYVPAQFRPETLACVYVGQDGIQFEAPTVFDNLIQLGEMPVTIGVFVTPGLVRAADSTAAMDRINRSYEYDALNDRYVRFLLEELLPDVETKQTSDGRPIRLSKRAGDRAIGGASSGAIAAFTAAWERPDAFTRVFSAIGSYVDIRGGDHYPALVRRFEPKGIRIVLQDGSNDFNVPWGDWWMANQTMARALTFAGYDVQHVWGDGAHDTQHATAIFPDAMRWLWRGWPAPVKTGQTQNATLNAILTPGEDWELVADGHGRTAGCVANANGEVFYRDVTHGKTYRVALNGEVSLYTTDAGQVNAQAFSPDGRLYTIGNGGLTAYTANGTATLIAGHIRGNDIAVTSLGRIYVTEPGRDGTEPSRIWLVRSDGEKRLVDAGLQCATGITLSPNQSLLYVADSHTSWVYSYQIQPDGSLNFKQPFFDLQVSSASRDSGAGGMVVDVDGRLYVATRLGVQILDQQGRVSAIMSVPTGQASSLSFGGKHFDRLFAGSGDKIFQRKLKVQGAY